ncbi:MAG: efflux RND transporter periplasmic adaptor subunit [Thalassobium sp.]|nr:MAG: efflux RND transporter periplasmic adaptor subunit [Oceanospirillales bacterium]PHQ83803.1 MAG: efflux RND transporter periplasmic adaptor subunit [Thalassobium sp.]
MIEPKQPVVSGNDFFRQRLVSPSAKYLSGITIMPIQINRSHVIAILIALLLVVWVVSGDAAEPDVADRPLNNQETSFKVGYEVFVPTQKASNVRISAHISANRSVDVVAEINGKVTALPLKRGALVNQGDTILEIDQRDLPAKLKQAKARLEQRQLETASVRNLYERGLTNQSAIASAEAELAEAEAIVTRARLDLEATRVKAPFSGVYDQRFVELGEYASVGQTLVRVVDNATMLIKGSVSENNINQIRKGTEAYAILPDDTRLTGTIRFIASSADAKTRTYPIEMEVNDAPAPLFDGQTATLFVPQGKVDAYFVSPSLLIITDNGGLGLKVITAEDTVAVVPVSILSAETNGIWIQGPTGEQRIITVGQGFVTVGEHVNAVLLNKEASQS